MPKFEKFQPGDRVKIIRLLDQTTNRELIGQKGVIEEVDDLPNGDYNYYVLVPGHFTRLFTREESSLYMHEEELELDIPATVLDRMSHG